MLPTARKARGTVTVSAKLALKAGSSQHGKIRRGEADPQAVRPRRDRLRKRQRRGLGNSIERDPGTLRAVVERDRAERRLDRVQDQPRGRLAHLDVHGLDARKLQALEIRRELDRIMDRDHRFRQLAWRGVEGKHRLGRGSSRDRQQQHEGRGKAAQCGGFVHRRVSSIGISLVAYHICTVMSA